MTQQTWKSYVKSAVPKTVTDKSYFVRAALTLFRGEELECNLCGFSGKFLPYGDPPRKNAGCPKCGSFERHRLVKLWLDTKPSVGPAMLHFAPEPGLAALFKTRVEQYQSADLDPDAGDIVLNIESIELPAESVDAVLASHVLEHVNDAKALVEINRILTPGGKAILMFPIIEGWDHTYENPDIKTPSGRAEHFGQVDHVRYYGRDVRNRITGAGFALSEFTAEEPYVSRHGLVRGEKIFVATKR